MQQSQARGRTLAIIAVDFDGTLVGESPDGELFPIAGAREALTELRRQGHRIVIHTCRTTLANDDGMLTQEVDLIEQTLADFAIPFDEIYVGDKLIADAYVDDRAVPFRGRWDETSTAVLDHLRGPAGKRKTP